MAKFQPGQSGNPKGAPKKGISIRGCLRASMDETVEVPQKDGSTKIVTKGEFLSSKLFQLAASGDLGAIKICLDNVDGPPTQTIGNPDGSALFPPRFDTAEGKAAILGSLTHGE